MTPREQHAADQADAFTAWAPRLDAHGFVCERQDPAGDTVRYTVRLTDEARTVVGEIAWSTRHKCYALTGAGSWQLIARSLRDLGEICQYLTARQRRRTPGKVAALPPPSQTRGRAR